MIDFSTASDDDLRILAARLGVQVTEDMRQGLLTALRAHIGIDEHGRWTTCERPPFARSLRAEAMMSAMERDIARNLNEALRERVAELRAEVDRLTKTSGR